MRCTRAEATTACMGLCVFAEGGAPEARRSVARGGAVDEERAAGHDDFAHVEALADLDQAICGQAHLDLSGHHGFLFRTRNPHASLVWLEDSDRAIILNSEGDLILARLNPTGYHEQSRTNIIGFTWAHPAFAGSRVYARSDTELVCVPLLPE